MIWDTVIAAVFKTIDKVLPDPAARDAAKLKVLELEQEGQLAQLKAETDLALEQIKVNAIEAQSTNVWVSGWRPGVGWVGVAALAYNYLARPMLPWLFRLIDVAVDDLPALDSSELMPLIFALLGLGAYRSYDKAKGTAS